MDFDRACMVGYLLWLSYMFIDNMSLAFYCPLNEPQGIHP